MKSRISSFSPISLSLLIAGNVLLLALLMLTFSMSSHAQCIAPGQETGPTAPGPEPEALLDSDTLVEPSFGLLPAGPLKDACIAKAKVDLALCEGVAEVPFLAAQVACLAVAAQGTKLYDSCISIPGAKYHVEIRICRTAFKVMMSLC